MTNGWLTDLGAVLPLLAVVAQAGISWWRVNHIEKEADELQDKVSALENWRAAQTATCEGCKQRIEEVHRKVFNGVRP